MVIHKQRVVWLRACTVIGMGRGSLKRGETHKRQQSLGPAGSNRTQALVLPLKGLTHGGPRAGPI